MGLFSLFGGSKKKEEEQAAAQEQLAKEAARKIVEEQKAAHADLPWPHPVAISRIKVAGGEPEILEDPVSAQRKDEIGPMVLDEKISLDVIRKLTLPELLFVLTTQEFFNAKSKLVNFSDNHRTLYNELLNRVREAETIYCIYDQASNYPFVENGFAYIYLEKETADIVTEAYNRQFRKLTVKACPAHPTGTSSKDRGFFDYLFYLGIERIIIENGRYRARFSRSEIVAPPNLEENAKQPPMNPQLRLAMLDFLSEIRWPVKYDKRAEIVRNKEMRMLTLARAARYIVPIQHEGPAEMMEDGRIKFNKDTKLRFPVMKAPNEKMYMPVFTDGIEFSKRFGKAGFEGAVFTFTDILRFVQDKDGIIINPMGENVALQKDKLLALEAVTQAAAAARQMKNPQVKQELSQEDIIKRTSVEDVANKIIQMPKKTAEDVSQPENDDEIPDATTDDTAEDTSDVMQDENSNEEIISDTEK